MWIPPPGPSVDLHVWRMVCFATVAATPRVLNYDLHILLIGALFQCRHSLAHGFYRGEQPLLAVAALGAFVALLFSPGLNPALALALFTGCWIGHGRATRQPA